MSQMSDPRVQTGARLSQELMERLKQSARKNNRTIGAEMEIAIQEYLDRENEGQLPAELVTMVEEYLRRHNLK